MCPQEPKDKSLKSKTNMNHKEEVKDQRPKPKEKRPEPKVEIKCQILKIKDHNLKIAGQMWVGGCLDSFR